MSHTTDLQTGDRFLFQGLTGQFNENPREIEIIKVDETGRVAVRIWLMDHDVADTFQGRYEYVMVTEAMDMIRQDIWKIVKEADK